MFIIRGQGFTTDWNFCQRVEGVIATAARNKGHVGQYCAVRLGFSVRSTRLPCTLKLVPPLEATPKR